MVRLKEIFGAGTAAVVSPIVGFSYKEEYFELPKLENSFALQIKEKLTNIQYKLAEDTFGWTVKDIMFSVQNNIHKKRFSIENRFFVNL